MDMQKTQGVHDAETLQHAPLVTFEEADINQLELTLTTLLKSGAHFGHQKARRHPRMDEYIYGTRNGISIIDLEKTIVKLHEALEFLARVQREGKQILFVGTKKQSCDLVAAAARYCGMPYVVGRWLGGTFTNFENIKKRVKYLIKAEESFAKGEFRRYTKFEQMKKVEEIEKMERKMGGLKTMAELPGAVFVTDLKEDDLAVKEARRVGIPVIAIADTNVDPTVAHYPIPANDEAIFSLRFILAHVCKALGKGVVSQNAPMPSTEHKQQM